MRNYNEFITKLRQAILERYQQGKPRLIYSDISKLGKEYDISVAEADAARKQAERQIMTESVNTANTGNKIMNTGKENTPLNPLSRGDFKNADGAFAQMQGKINRDVKRVVDRGIKNKYSASDIEKMLNRTLNKGKRISKTITRTARLAKIRSDYLIKHLKAGAKYFRYAGPGGGSRQFCSEHLGKIYTINEINSLDNKQGLPVLVYMGGWNCRHRWEAVYGAMVKNIFIDKSWSDQYKSANKKDKPKMKQEFGNGQMLKEINPKFSIIFTIEKAKNDGQIDCRVNNGKAEFKNPVSTKEDILRETIRGAKKQSDDVYIFLESEIEMYDLQILRLKGWLKRHKEKKCYIINKKNKTIIEVKNDQR